MQINWSDFKKTFRARLVEELPDSLSSEDIKLYSWQQIIEHSLEEAIDAAIMKTLKDFGIADAAMK